MKVQIVVDEDCIARGRAGLCEVCPVALAMREALPECYDHEASTDALRFRKRGFPYRRSGHLWTARTPQDAEDFMMAFDASESVLPFEFTSEFAEAAA